MYGMCVCMYVMLGYGMIVCNVLQECLAMLCPYGLLSLLWFVMYACYVCVYVRYVCICFVCVYVMYVLCVFGM